MGRKGKKGKVCVLCGVWCVVCVVVSLCGGGIVGGGVEGERNTGQLGESTRRWLTAAPSRWYSYYFMYMLDKV